MANAIYTPLTLEVDDILKDVRSGKIGLPDLQRPFVWKNDKVRQLLDSMLMGYPIGYIMLWASPAESDSNKTSAIGTNVKTYEAPAELVIDGQQRLTALLATFYGIKVTDQHFKEREIRIAFDPVSREFKNADASTDNDPRFVSNVSDLFQANREKHLSKFRRAFFKRIDDSRSKHGEPELTDDEMDEMERGMNELLSLEQYQLPTLRIKAVADEEMVGEVFVRVNSQGQALKQDDFIMTLLSVYEPEMRKRIERFCEDSHKAVPGTSYNALIKLSATNIIRATVGVGFKRGRLRYAYQILRGRNLETKVTSKKQREDNFKIFGDALDKVLDVNNWHAFINILGEAGYISSSQVSSETGLMYCYAFYLIGKFEFKMGTLELRRLIRRWYYACSLTAYYVGSFETVVERQLTDIKGLADAKEYEAYFDRAIAGLLTDDYFSITLPQGFDAKDATGPTWNAFVAAQIVIGAKGLFTTVPLSTLVAPSSSGSKKSLDKHHLFPRDYLVKLGYHKDIVRNRANFTYVDYGNNIYISNDAPSSYVPKYRADMGEDEYRRNCHEHALPEGFENMEYETFLQARRPLMAAIVKEGFEAL